LFTLVAFMIAPRDLLKSFLVAFGPVLTVFLDLIEADVD